MKTRLFISKLRAAAEVAALVVFVLLMVLITVSYHHTMQSLLFRFWPIVTVVLIVYTVLSLTEDYLNHRISCRYPQFT